MFIYFKDLKKKKNIPVRFLIEVPLYNSHFSQLQGKVTPVACWFEILIEEIAQRKHLWC
jgi:hypothetical protein